MNIHTETITDMKARYIMILSIFAMALASCKVNDIAYYSDDARIEFSGASSYTFTDEDWLEEYVLGRDSYIDGRFTAQLIGYFLDTPRTFCVQATPVETSLFTPELEFDNPYQFPAGVVTVDAGFRIKCPSKENASTRSTDKNGYVDIVYDNSSEYQQFGQGRVENLSYRVTVNLDLYPDDWNAAFWGRYSVSKYILMMETFRCVHGDIERDFDSYMAIVKAYALYKLENGPLYGDDEYSDEEIEFPAFN